MFHITQHTQMIETLMPQLQISSIRDNPRHIFGESYPQIQLDNLHENQAILPLLCAAYDLTINVGLLKAVAIIQAD